MSQISNRLELSQNNLSDLILQLSDIRQKLSYFTGFDKYLNKLVEVVAVLESARAPIPIEKPNILISPNEIFISEKYDQIPNHYDFEEPLYEPLYVNEQGEVSIFKGHLPLSNKH